MKNIGDPIERRDGRDKVTGAAHYAYEVPVPGAAYGVLVTSNIAKGRIVDIDTSAAEKEPGVIAVITPRNALKLPGEPHLDPPDRVVQVLQDDRILFSNQPVAVAVADTFERAVHAALLVRVHAEAAPHTVRLEDQLRRQQTVISRDKGELRTNLTGRIDVQSLRLHATSSMQLLREAHRIVLELAGVHRRLEAARVELVQAAKQRLDHATRD